MPRTRSAPEAAVADKTPPTSPDFYAVAMQTRMELDAAIKAQVNADDPRHDAVDKLCRARVLVLDAAKAVREAMAAAGTR
jgi:hypothetical protein